VFSVVDLLLFVLRIAGHQLLYCRAGRDLAVEYGGHGARDGHLDAKFGRAAGDFARRRHALGDMAELAHDLVQRQAPGQAQTHLAVARQVAGAGEDQVADPGQAHEGLGSGAQRLAKPRDLGKAARDQGGAGIEAEAEAVSVDGIVEKLLNGAR